MSDELSGIFASRVQKAFPYGAKVVQDGQDPVGIIGVVGAIIGTDQVIHGWALPSKDMYYTVKDITERPDGWLAWANGSKVLFKPLTQAQGDQIDANMKEIS